MYISIYIQSQRAGYKPGDLDFDPLRLHSFRSSFGLDQITEKISREEKLARAKFDMVYAYIYFYICMNMNGSFVCTRTIF